jgi:cytochrome b561
MRSSDWSVATRWLHLGMAVTITFQLLVSLIMAAPDEEKASAAARMAFELHEIGGILALLVVLAHWAWTLSSRSNGGLAHLFPYRGAAWLAVKSDLTGLRAGQLPEGGARGGLPGLIHGLGFLAATAMALSGGVLLAVLPESGSPSDAAEGVMELHEAMATFVWVYWGAHIAMGLLHHWRGHGNLKAMFDLSRGNHSPQDQAQRHLGL